ncbi:MAG: carboxypeptidase regulatory-like domain-containing protein [Planctomycetaceae bacterium]|nr:carboxypeptidase regulatory-like domain-containing protein [Planctomycetales bacterium]MCB9927087.1 carboxypeptidase regulatory-like domain-containing protein [Planctomycetaceae bacterium]
MVRSRRLGFESLETRRLLTAVDIPDDLTGQVLALVSTPLNIDNASGIRAAEVRLAYDTTQLDISESDVLAGNVWSSDATVDVVASVDDAAGTIVVSIFAANALPVTSGSLVEFRFTIQSGATVGASTVIDLTEVRLNEGAITLDVTPQPGSDATDGRITVTEDDNPPTGDAMVSGTVYADVNTNNQADSTEGLSGITVTLVNTVTNAQVQTTTQSDGSYQFANVSPGTYRIQESQPAAYIDGGVNEIAVELIANQNLTGQDFRELGLRPEFIYNRLFTTLVMPIGSTNWIAEVQQINADAESGVSNAQTVTVSNTPQAEGEGPTSIAAQVTATPILTLQPEGEGSSDVIVSGAALVKPSETQISTVCTISDTSPAINMTPAITTTAVAEQAETKIATLDVRSMDAIWSENFPQPNVVAEGEAPSSEQFCDLSDELLTLDEVFAVTDSW